MATTYSPSKMRVPSAIRGLTSLFGMGRGEHPWKNHHKKVNITRSNKNKIYWKTNNQSNIKNKAYGQLVLLGFVVTNFTPIAYQRHSL